MRITGPNSIKPVQPVKRKTGQDGKSDFASEVSETQETSAPKAPVQVSSVAALDTLIAVQSVDPREEGRVQTLKDADDLLKTLEQVRRGILLGAIPVGRLQNIVSRIEKTDRAFVDPTLIDIMDEVVLRARVELAKMGIYR